MYDFEKYYTDMNVKADVNIDLSGVQIENPQGNPNEHVSNNVVYYVTGALLSNDESFANSVALGINERIQVVIGEGADAEYAYIALYHPLSDILDIDVAHRWEPKEKRETEIELDSDDTIVYNVLHDDTGGQITSYTHAKLFVTPRYEFITGNGSDNIVARVGTGNVGPLFVNQNIISNKSNVKSMSVTMQTIYSILGLCGRRKTNLKQIRKINEDKTGRRNAVIGYDLFMKRINQISDWCSDNNYGVDVKIYDGTYAKPLPEGLVDATPMEYLLNRKKAREKHHIYVMACKKSDIARTAMRRVTSFNDAFGTSQEPGGHLSKFLDGGESGKLIDDLRSSGVGVTALIPPIKDAVKGMFYPKDDLENDFYDEFEAVFNDLKVALSIMRKYLGGKTKRELSKLDETYTRYSTGSRSLAFDLDSLVNSFEMNYREINRDKTNKSGIYATGNVSNTEQLVTVYPRVFEIGGKYEESENRLVSWCSAPNPIDPNGSGVGFHYAYAGSGDYTAACDKWDYSWDKTIVSMRWDEVRDILVDSYNLVLKQANETPVSVEELNITETSFENGYSGLEDPDIRIRQCKRYIEMVAGWMNLFAGKSKLEMWKFINDHPLNPGENIMSWLTRLSSIGLVNWNLHGTYDVIVWNRSSSTRDGEVAYSNFEPSFTMEWGIDPESGADIDDAIRAAFVMKRAYKEMRSELVSNALSMNPYKVIKAWLALEDASDSIGDLNETLDRIIWYQAFVNESVFTNKSMYLNASMWLNYSGGPEDDDGFVKLGFTPWTLPARFMVPVATYRKVRKRYKRFGFTRHKTVKRYDGVRWAEVRFYDLNVYNEYPQVTETPGNTVALGIPCYIGMEGDRWCLNFDEPLPETVTNAGRGEVKFDDLTQSTVQVVFDTEMTAHVPDGTDAPTLTGNHVAVSVKVPPERSRNDTENKSSVTMHIKMPGLPYDEEIRKNAFVEYGSLSQDKMFEVTRYGAGGFSVDPDAPRVDGWKIFRPTSRKIEDMREGIGIYDKVAFLLSILKHEFGEKRVELINTWRSSEDQKGICTGGPESEMLSWHNYGLAAKILIYQDDCTTPIVDMSDDMKRLVKVAKAFTEICGDGRMGAPCNVVWCGRLAVSPSLFDWEFLPVGVGHKDAFRFREAIMSQKDPILECSYVDVDAAGFVSERPRDDAPFILRKSNAYKNARVISGHHFVSPDKIPNYNTPSDIVLYDIVEYIDLINLKMSANGNKLGERGNMYEWKAMNDASCEQLIRYFAITNNIKSAKALIAGDFIEKYQPIEDAYYSTSVVEYVRNMLGSHYESAYISIDANNDGGYISLANGKMYIKSTDIIPDNIPTVIDMHGQQKVDMNHIKRGVWRNGVFYGEDEIELPLIESDMPVIDGYVDGIPVQGEALFIHQLIASEIHAEFLKVRDLFERYTGSVMFDRFQDGPNASKFAQLENEFGAISAQDLMSFDELESIIAQDNIDVVADIEPNGERNAVGYEKVVDNALLAGMRKAVKTRERMHITDRGGGLTPGEIYRAVMEGRAPGANDLMSGR